MIFNKLYAFIVSQTVEVISFFYPLNNRLFIFNSTNNNNFNFNSKFLFTYLLENHKNEFQLYFVINDVKKRRELNEKFGDYFISNNSYKDLLLISRAKCWLSSDLKTPYLTFPFLKNRKRIVFHLGHGVPLKKIILFQNHIPLLKKINRYLRTRMFTHVESYSSKFESVMKKSFRNNKIKYVKLGQPRNDFILSSGDSNFNVIVNEFPELDFSGKKKILYAPTWRSYAKTYFFPFPNISLSELNEYLINNDTVLFLRDHPYFNFTLNEDISLLSNIQFFNSDKFPEIIDYFSFFDGLITDYSSLYLDYLCLDHPIGFIPYDRSEYENKIGFSMDYNILAPGVHIHNELQLLDFINLKDGFSEFRTHVRSITNTTSDNNCYRYYLFLKKLASEG